MTRVAAQAQECGRLMQQVVGYRTMWVVADGAVFFDRRVLVDKRALFIGVTSITNQVDRVGFQVPFGLSVRIVAIGAGNFSLLDRMVGW